MSGHPKSTSDLSASALSTPHFPRHPPKWSDIRRYRRVIPEAAYITLRHYETIVVIDSHSGKKDHRILSLSEDRFYILEHKKYHQVCPLPVLLKDIIRIDRLDGKHQSVFRNQRLDQMTQHIKIGLNRKEEKGQRDYIELFTWETESKLLWHLKRAWYTYSVRFMQGIPISISMQGDEADVKRLYNDIEDEIIECQPHGNKMEAQACGELLHELTEALLQDRQVKSMFFDSGKLLRYILKNLALLQANDSAITRNSQLRLVIAMLTTIHAALFNSETLDRRLNMLVPVPHSFSGMVEILTLNYGKRAASKASKELQKQIELVNKKKAASNAKDYVENLISQRDDGTNPRLVIHDMLRSTMKLGDSYGDVRSSGESTINYGSPLNSPNRRQIPTEDYYDDHSTYHSKVNETDTPYNEELGKSLKHKDYTRNESKHDDIVDETKTSIKDYDDLSKTLKKGMSTMSFVTDTASGNAHTNIKNRIHRSNSMMHIWSHSGRRTSAVPPTWSKAKSHGINVNLTSSFKQNNNTNDTASNNNNKNNNINRTAVNYDEFDLNNAEHVGHALMMTASSWETTKTKVAEKEARLFGMQYTHEAQFEEDVLGKEYLEKKQFGEETSSGSDDSDVEVESSAYGNTKGKTNEATIEIELIRRIDLLQCLVLNELELIVEHGVFHKSGHVFESFGETVANIPNWGKNRLNAYVKCLRELITHRSEDHLPSATFSWLVSEISTFIYNLSIGTYKLREHFKMYCDADIKYYFCDNNFVQNIEPRLFLNSFSLKTLDEALIWILHSDDAAGDEKKMKQQKKGDDIIKWEYKKILTATGHDEYKYGPYTHLKRKSNRTRTYFPIYYNGEPIIDNGNDDGISGMLTFTSVSTLISYMIDLIIMKKYFLSKRFLTCL